ncbi:MAG: DUF5020 family protein [Bacteroidales bacterium]|nr:DUF5020 family protein [Bacteroidales bacterium]MBQ3941933.1 DUF5020 family protein [Bacteroidales bacterium]
MSKKLFLAAAFAVLAFTQGAKAQTNLQTFYDFGKNRGHFTTTLEGFYGDNWGNTFFFIDYDFNHKDTNGVNQAPSGSYMEIARCLNFWQNTALAPLSLQVEYNGLVGVNQNFLFGLDYFVHNSDFSNTFNFKVLYKTFSIGVTSDVPVQFTFVWGMQDLFGLKGLRFSGFADIWGENVINFMEGLDKPRKFVFISEPQLWYCIGQHFGVPNLSIGGEVELSCNFAGYDGFYARPCIGTKWVF